MLQTKHRKTFEDMRKYQYIISKYELLSFFVPQNAEQGLIVITWWAEPIP